MVGSIVSTRYTRAFTTFSENQDRLSEHFLDVIRELRSVEWFAHDVVLVEVVLIVGVCDSRGSQAIVDAVCSRRMASTRPSVFGNDREGERHL